MTHPDIAVVRVTAPAVSPLTLSEVKLYLRIEHTAEDALVAQWIQAATEAAEKFLGVSLITQSHRLWVRAPWSACLHMPKGPIQEIQTAEIRGLDGSTTTLDPETYVLYPARALLQWLSVPVGEELIITYVAGFGDGASDVPSLIRQGMLHHIAAMAEAREGGAGIPDLAKALYQPFREVRI
jgi:uncharacterized phiE125 gp8 family phage protein